MRPHLPAGAPDTDGAPDTGGAPDTAGAPDTPARRAREGAEAHDEIGIPAGPDGDARGLFDAPFTGTATGERTAGAPSEPDRPSEQRRTAVLAWIAAEGLPATPAGPGEPTPCAPLKRLIADEPLDPLPALDGVPARVRAPRTRPRDAGALASEREDTATQIEGLEARLDRRAAEEAPPSAGAPSGETDPTGAPPPSGPPDATAGPGPDAPPGGAAPTADAARPAAERRRGGPSPLPRAVAIVLVLAAAALLLSYLSAR